MLDKHFKKIIMAVGSALLFIPQIAKAQVGSPITENSSSAATVWNDVNKGTLQRGEVSHLGKVILKVTREGNVAHISLPQPARALESRLWIFDASYNGQTNRANWDAKSKSWRFNLKGKGTYTIYISKRKNNTENIPYLWFNLAY